MATHVEARGVRRLAVGAGLGVAGAISGFVLPVAFLALAEWDPGGFFTFGSDLLRAISILVVAGGLLLLLSFFVYRRGFAALRAVDGRFAVASVLCLVGTVGLLLVLVAAAYLAGSTSSVVTCASGSPTHLLSCLRSASPIGGAAGLLGAVLTWVGGLGLVIGLAAAGSRYHRPSIGTGSGLYGLLLLVLLAPFAAVLASVPEIQYVILAIPILGLLAPAFVMAGSVRELPIVETR